MRLFLYYGLHSFVNQLKKLFKTWVLVFIVICFLVGGGIGAGVAALQDATESREESHLEESQDSSAEEAAASAETPAEAETPSEAETPADAGGELVFPVEDQPKENPFEKPAFLEAIAGLLILGVLAFEILSADRNGSKIFLPADVPLLFAAPMKPQSVLLFRLMTQMGTAIVASLYLLFQLPNLILNLGLGLFSALGLIVAWILLIILGRLVQVLLYTVCSTHPEFKPWIRRILYAVLILFVVGMIWYLYSTGDIYISPYFAAKGGVDYLTLSWTRWIPIWGWLKGFVRMALDGNLVGSLIYLRLCVAAIVILVVVIYHVKADFYEDAMAKSEETAEILARAQSSEGGLFVGTRRKKDRSDSLTRDGLNKGSGASIFLQKAIYNRWRFAHLKIFTKTAETYLIFSVGVSLLVRFVAESNTLVPTALTLAALAFFRTLGNPLTQDTQMSYFTLIPETTGKKLFFSLLGGSYNCLMDVIIGLFPAVLILNASPLDALLWAVVIVSIDFYATVTATFIDLSVPVHTGKTIKQFIQILFIYFGLIPDVVVIALSLALLQMPVMAAAGTILINLFFGGLFFFLSVMAIDHAFGK